jgi:hypothetical protein
MKKKNKENTGTLLMFLQGLKQPTNRAEQNSGRNETQDKNNQETYEFSLKKVTEKEGNR